MFIVQYRNIFFAITGLIVLASLISVFVFGLNIGTDFTGGTLAEVTYPSERPDRDTLIRSLDQAGFEHYSLREAGDNKYILRAPVLTDEQRGVLPTLVGGTSGGTISQLTEVGPTIGVELRNKALIALALVIICILFFIAFAFRHVSEPISSWVYGLIAIVALVHDVIVPIGAFAFFGYLWGAQVDTLFVTALLTILGFSVHDTIVVFDRTRENLRINQERNRKEPFSEVAGRSLHQTMVRSINTSVTVAISLLALYILGPASTKDFAITLLVGIVAGTYSSVALATPLLVAVERYQARKR
jgi:preprotein translocase subunit SecF